MCVDMAIAKTMSDSNDANKAAVDVKVADSKQDMHKSLESTTEKFIKNGLKELDKIFQDIHNMTYKDLKTVLEGFMHRKRDQET